MTRTPSILILTPFRNESHSFPLYLKSLLALDYPRDKIDIYWLENDSSDDTPELLQQAVNKLKKSRRPFNSITFESVEIIGRVPINEDPESVTKDLGYGPQRVRSWLAIWNQRFLPVIKKSNVDYVLCWYADSVIPPETIKEYLKVYRWYEKKKQDNPNDKRIQRNGVGWVGGSICSRYPNHNVIRCPFPTELVYSPSPCECRYVGHVWTMPRESMKDMKFYAPTAQDYHMRFSGGARRGFADMHLCLIWQFEEKGLWTYYQPSIFIQHVSKDGKIWTKELPMELKEC